MDTIFKIYKRDLKRIIKNPALIIIIGLVVVPALYAWINIIATWDPYGNTKGLSVAINNMENITSYINTDLITAKSNIDSAIADLNNISDSITEDASDQTQSLKSVYDKLNSAITSLNNNINVMQSINNVLNSNAISNFIGTLQDIRNKLTKDNENLNDLINTLNKGQQISTYAIKAIIQNINIASKRIDSAIGNYNNNISPLVTNFMNNSIGMTDNSLKLLQNAPNNIPLMSNLMKLKKVD